MNFKKLAMFLAFLPLGPLLNALEYPAITQVLDGTTTVEVPYSTAALSGVNSFLYANWTQAPGTVNYKYAIGTAPDITDITGGWRDNGINTSTKAAHFIPNLVNGQIYYFAVRAQGPSGLLSGPTTSNGQMVDNLTPNQPPVVNDGGVIGSNINTTTITAHISANWQISSALSGIAKYWYAIGTTSGGTDITGWTDGGPYNISFVGAIPYTSTTVSVAHKVTGGRLTPGQRYYFSVKAQSGSGLLSPAGNSDGAIINSSSPTAVSNVYDGTTTATGISYHTDSVVAGAGYLSANWTTSDDVVNYQYRIIRQAAGLPVLQDWKDNGTQISTTATKLSLTQASTYYVVIRAENGAGQLSQWTTSQGQVVDISSANTPTVWDGLGAGDAKYFSDPTQLSAHWISTDTQSGVVNYKYGISKSQTNFRAPYIVQDWTDNGPSTYTITTAFIAPLTNGNTYYFYVKAVNGAGLLSQITTSNGVILVSAPPIYDITPPSTIARVYDGPYLGVNTHYTTSKTALYANWPASSDPQSGINKYWYAIGTNRDDPSDTTKITVGDTDAWIDNGAALTAAEQDLSLSIGTTYYFFVQAENGVGLLSQTTTSNGQMVTAANMVTAVNDGTGGDIDYTTDTTQLSANWPASPDADGYQYAIGKTPGGADVVGWSDNGLNTSVTAQGLSLTVGTTYYFSVEAGQLVGSDMTWSDPTYSDGVTVSAGPTGYHNHTATLLPDGNFLVVGGVDSFSNATNNVEIYFASAAAWGQGNAINVARSSHTATLLGNGRVLVAGGFANGAPLQSAEIYNPATGAWTNLGATAMKSARGGHTATLLTKGAWAGTVLICGGQVSAAGAVTTSCERFTPAAEPATGGAFTNLTNMTSPRMGHTASLLNSGRVFLSGGVAGGSNYLSTNEIYDPETNACTPVSPLLEGRAQHSATVLNNGNVLIAGGYNAWNQDDQFSIDDDATRLAQQQGNQGYLESAEMFNPYGARVSITGKTYNVMPYRNSGYGALLKPNGDVHLQGGYGNIPVTYFNPTPILSSSSYVNLSPTGSVIGGDISFYLDTTVSRAVSGRIVNGDVFFSPPPPPANPTDPPAPSIALENIQIYLPASKAATDGLQITKGPDGTGGVFQNVVRLTNPEATTLGTVTFDPIDTTGNDTNAKGRFYCDPATVPADTPADILDTSTMTANFSFIVPEMYIGAILTGTIDLMSGTIVNSTPAYTVSFGKDGASGGTGNFRSNTVTEKYVGLVRSGLATAQNVKLTALQGTLTNNSTTTPLPPVNGGLDFNQKMTGIELSVNFNSNRLSLTPSGSQTSFACGASTIVVREMIFADDLAYNPADSSWSFNPLSTFYPVFNNSAFLTPADDMMVIGGRNCETQPGSWCTRAAKRFEPAAGKVYINQNLSAWPPAASLNTKRAFHTSTLLPDGDILTCGGANAAQTLSSCELYDKTAKTWKDIGSMNYSRSNHTATLLANGNVLIVGGTINAATAAVTTAEIYYPSSKKFALTSSMSTPRSDHTATLLPDGNVLVAGGNSGNAYADSSEIYIATAAKWQIRGTGADTLTTARSQHTATLLKNGTVLVTGGINGLGATPTAEVYNTLTHQWSAAPAGLGTKRYSHTANLLRDGRVLVVGGSDGSQPLKSAELYDGVKWTLTKNFPGTGLGSELTLSRANHTSTLLPNGKILVTGGEAAGTARNLVEGYDADFNSWQAQGTTEMRGHHTTVLMEDGSLMNIGGFDGANYLNSTEMIYFTDTPDLDGLDTIIARQPLISSGTTLLSRGLRATLTSGTTNFHGLTEASGGGAGTMSSSFSNPRIYMQAIDNPSGFLTDMTTRLYTLYDNSNSASWETTLSSITITMPVTPGEMPYGWYHMRVATNGQFSNAHTVQVTVPRPSGATTVPMGSVMGSTSVQWTWEQGTLPSGTDGYAIFSSSDNASIATVPFGDPDPTKYIQTGLTPNSAASVKVGGYNTGGYGALTGSDTYYTLAATPQNLNVEAASFEAVRLSWDPMGNSPQTIYEVSVSKSISFDPAFVAVSFNDKYTSTSTTMTNLDPGQLYYFRVRAQNMDGYQTDYNSASITNPSAASTVTVSNINNLTGTAQTMSSINWSWTPVETVDPLNPTVARGFYEVYDVTGGTDTAVFIASTTFSNLTQVNLSTNTAHTVAVNAVRNVGTGYVHGPKAISSPVYTLAVQPSPGGGLGGGLVFSDIKSDRFTLNWIANGNSSSTVYNIRTSIISSGTVLGTTLTVSTGTTVIISTWTAAAGNGSVTVPDLIPNTQYFASIVALNGDGVGTTPLFLGSAYTLAQTPTNFRPTDVSMSGISLAWDTGTNTPETPYEIRGSTTLDSKGNLASIVIDKPFTSYTSDTISFSGLLTATTYYFDISARNGAGSPSGYQQSVPMAVTLPGPDGAPSGSIGGTSQPGSDVTIEGTLPDGRTVSLFLPAGSFKSQTAVAISPSATNDCRQSAIPHVEVAVHTENKAQPQVPITLKLSYTSDEANAGVTDYSSSLALARYSEAGECLPLETKIGPCGVNPFDRCIAAKLNHLSVFQLMLNTAATSLSAVRVYPNPFYTNRGQGFVTIDRLPALATVRIYTLSGDKVWEGTAGTTGVLTWSAVNNSGVLVGSGIYLAAIDSTVGKKVLKIAIER